MPSSRQRRRLAIPAAVATLGLGLAVLAPSPALAAEREKPPTIVDLAVATPELSTLVAAVQRAGLVEVLADRKSTFTVFAPTNDAFAALLEQLGYDSLEEVPVDALTSVLLDHVVDRKLKSKQLAVYDRTDWPVPTLGGLALDADAEPLSVNDADVVIPDVIAANGVVHVIDTVLVDPDPRPTITDLAVATPELSILVEAVVRAGLADTLAQPGPYTVFAPTNDAFVALLGQLGLGSLDDVPTDVLTAVLLDHVVARELDAAEVLARAASGRGAQTLGGLRLTFDDSPPSVNGAGIVAVDVEGRNGTVHVIDAVLLQG